jgi:hypothetical protein
MKSFKNFLLEQKEYSTINLMLADYVSGSIEEFDNKGTFLNLFDPNGEGLPKILKIYNLTLIQDGELFSGRGVVVKDHMNIDVSKDEQPYNKIKTLSIEVEKLDDGDVMITSAKVI